MELTACCLVSSTHHLPSISSSSVLDWVVIKLGAEGAVLFERDSMHGNGLWSSPFRVDVVDTVGCGDSFAAALALGRIRGLDVPATLTLANAVGASTATRRGAGRNVATADLVTELLQNRNDDAARSALDSINMEDEGGQTPSVELGGGPAAGPSSSLKVELQSGRGPAMIDQKL